MNKCSSNLYPLFLNKYWWNSRVVLLSIVALFFLGCTSKPAKIKLIFTGDLLLDRGVRKTIESKGVDYLFSHVKPLLLQQNFVIANFEGTVCDSGLAPSPKQFCFRADPDWMPKLIENGITTVSLANNHSGDYGKEGLRQTAMYLHKNGIVTMGYKEAADPCSPLILEKNGVKLAIFSSSFLYEKDPSGICHSSDSILCQRIHAFEKNHYGYQIILCLHWGIEMKEVPEVKQVAQAHALIDAGADLIIGHHPHVVQAIEKYKDKYICYSLGNFIFDNEKSLTNMGILSCFSVYTNYIELEQVVPFTIFNTKPVLMNQEESESIVNSLSHSF